MFLQLVISGLSFGSLYALIALAMVIVYKTSEVPNFGQGEMAMISTFVAYMLLVSYECSWAVSFLGAFIFAAALGAFLVASVAFGAIVHLDDRDAVEDDDGFTGADFDAGSTSVA